MAELIDFDLPVSSEKIIKVIGSAAAAEMQSITCSGRG